MKEEDENCHGQPNLFSMMTAFWPEMEAQVLRDDMIIHMSQCQVFQQITILEEEYQEVGEPESKEDNYHLHLMTVPNIVIGKSTNLEDSSEKKNRKNRSSYANLSQG